MHLQDNIIFILINSIKYSKAVEKEGKRNPITPKVRGFKIFNGPIICHILEVQLIFDH